jgi:hypothetical protein
MATVSHSVTKKEVSSLYSMLRLVKHEGGQLPRGPITPPHPNHFNKLKKIKPLIGATKTPGIASRRDEIVYHRTYTSYTFMEIIIIIIIITFLD